MTDHYSLLPALRQEFQISRCAPNKYEHFKVRQSAGETILNTLHAFKHRFKKSKFIGKIQLFLKNSNFPNIYYKFKYELLSQHVILRP